MLSYACIYVYIIAFTNYEFRVDDQIYSTVSYHCRDWEERYVVGKLWGGKEVE
jgi:hypothetical protein